MGSIGPSLREWTTHALEIRRFIVSARTTVMLQRLVLTADSRWWLAVVEEAGLQECCGQRALLDKDVLQLRPANAPSRAMMRHLRAVPSGSPTWPTVRLLQ